MLPKRRNKGVKVLNSKKMIQINNKLVFITKACHFLFLHVQENNHKNYPADYIYKYYLLILFQTFNEKYHINLIKYIFINLFLCF
jgi:hypothetical protein